MFNFYFFSLFILVAMILTLMKITICKNSSKEQKSCLIKEADLFIDCCSKIKECKDDRISKISKKKVDLNDKKNVNEFGSKFFFTNLDIEDIVTNNYKNDFLPFHKQNHETETKYLQTIFKKSLNYVVMDGMILDGIELCDVLKDANTFIHVKRGTRGSKMSHLFWQSYVSIIKYLYEKEKVIQFIKFRTGVDVYEIKSVVLVIITNKISKHHNYKISEILSNFGYIALFGLFNLFSCARKNGIDLKIQFIESNV
jgi:hypothetical protein